MSRAPLWIAALLIAGCGRKPAPIPPVKPAVVIASDPLLVAITTGPQEGWAQAEHDLVYRGIAWGANYDKALGEIQDPAARERLKRVIRKIRIAAMIGPKAADDFFAAETSKEKWAVLKLVRYPFRYPEAAPVILEEFGRLPLDRREKLELLNWIGENSIKTSGDWLTRCLADPSAEIRANALHTLQRIRIPDLNAAVVRLVEDPDNGVRIQAASAAGSLKATAAVPALARHMLDKKEDLVVRANCMTALGELQAKDQEPAVLSMLQEESLRLRSDAILTLSKMQGPKAAEALIPLLTHPEVGIRRYCVGALVRLDPAAHAGHAVAALKDPSDLVREAAVIALRDCRDPRHAVPVAELLEDPSDQVLEVVLQVIGIYKPPVQASRIAALMDHGTPSVRTGAVGTLAVLGAREYAPRIAERLGLGDPDARSNAANALRLLGDKGALPLLEAALAKERHEVVKRSLQEAIQQLRSQP